MTGYDLQSAGFGHNARPAIGRGRLNLNHWPENGSLDPCRYCNAPK
ncbi:MAG: hypothetical protein SPL30_09320 [Succinivibrio sp.]|nr:hypothetical protein [Succinivibrio sp.]